MERAVWIVHGDAQARTALARIAGLPALLGPPRLEAFPPAPSPAVVVLHVPLAANEALAFAHAAAARHPRAQWLLIADPGLAADWLLAAFAGLRATPLRWPPEATTLPQAIRRALAGGAPSVGQRRQRDALVARFARTLGDLAIPEPVLDASGHLAITGERGTGKLLVARTLHALWDTAEDEGRAGFVLLGGDASAAGAALEAQLARAAEHAERLVVCVEDPAAFAHSVQREIASWVELGPPAAGLDPLRLLWVFLRPESFGGVASLEPALAELCESPALRIPPLRERPGAALRLAEQWLREGYAAQDQPPRALAPSAQRAIEADPWPGNARELEAALRRAVLSPGAEPIEADALGLANAAHDGELTPPGAQDEIPGDAREFSTVIEELDAARASEASGDDYETRRDDSPAAVAAPAPSTPATPASSPQAADLRAFARATSRELAPALETLRAREGDPAAARLARRIARLEEFAGLEATRSKGSEVAPLLAALLAERREDLLAKRLLVLRELESDDTQAQANAPALRFALAALLDTLIEAAPTRTDLYLSARATTISGRPTIRVVLRLNATRIAENTLDLTLAKDLLTRLGATLDLETNDTETRVTIDLPS